MRHIPLAALTAFVSGGTPTQSERAVAGGDVPWITGADIDGNGHLTPREYITAKAVANSAVTVVPSGSVLLVTRTAVGKVAVADREVGFSQDITALIPNRELVDEGYLARFLAYYSPQLARESRGATIKGVERDSVARISVPVPDLHRQRRVNEMLGKADGVRKLRLSSLDKLQSLRMSILREELADTSRLDSQRVRLREVIIETRNGLYVPARQYGKGVPIVRISDFEAGSALSEPPPRSVDIDPLTAERFALRFGDIVFNRVNAISHVGKSALITSETAGWVFESNMIRVRFDTSRVIPAFVMELLSQRPALLSLRARAKQSINQASLSQADLGELEVGLPSLEHQRHTLARLNKIDFASAQLKLHLAKLDELFASLQHRAFTGQL